MAPPARVRIEPGIYRHRNGTWEIYAHVDGLPQYHKRLASSLSRREVRELRDAELRRLRKMKAEPALRGTLARDAAAYLALASVRAMPTYATRRRHILAWCDAFGHRLRHSLTPAEIDAQLEHWQAVGLDAGRPRRLSPSYVNRLRTALGHLFSKLDLGKALPNPVYVTARRAEPPALPRGFGFDVARELLAAMPDRGQGVRGEERRALSFTKLRLTILAWTGLRPEELMRVRPTDWNRSAGTLFVHAAKASRQRTIPLLAPATAALEALEAAGGLWRPDGAPVRWSTSSARQSWRRAWRLVNTARRKAKEPALPWIRPYDLRHTFLTELLTATRDLETVREWAGHADAAMTRRYTLAGVPVNVAAGAEILARALPPPVADAATDGKEKGST